MGKVRQRCTVVLHLVKAPRKHLWLSRSSALIFLVSFICLWNCCQNLLKMPVSKCKPLLKNLWLKTKTSSSKTFLLFLEVLHVHHIISRCGFVITYPVCLQCVLVGFFSCGEFSAVTSLDVAFLLFPPTLSFCATPLTYVGAFQSVLSIAYFLFYIF